MGDVRTPKLGAPPGFPRFCSHFVWVHTHIVLNYFDLPFKLNLDMMQNMYYDR